MKGCSGAGIAADGGTAGIAVSTDDFAASDIAGAERFSKLGPGFFVSVADAETCTSSCVPIEMNEDSGLAAGLAETGGMAGVSVSFEPDVALGARFMLPQGVSGSATGVCGFFQDGADSRLLLGTV